MKHLIPVFLILTILSACKEKEPPPEYALVIHGGAGTILKENMDEALEKEYMLKLEEALQVGKSVLENGGTAVEAVERTIRVMEDSPLFNAGRGSVFNELGRNEMDASIMNGADLNAGSVAGVSTIRNPVSAARRVMEQSPHVMLTGGGAEKFAAEQGLETADSAYFFVESRWNAFLRAQAAEKNGTVGAVALDRDGNIAAGTSTGGMTDKMWGRVGDAPLIGAGTYADNGTCGISCTGHGEYFIRNVVAFQVAALMKYRGMSLGEACHEMINVRLKNIGASGGAIALDRKGHIVMEFNTAGMYRGYIRSDGTRDIKIYR